MVARSEAEAMCPDRIEIPRLRAWHPRWPTGLGALADDLFCDRWQKGRERPSDVWLALRLPGIVPVVC